MTITKHHGQYIINPEDGTAIIDSGQENTLIVNRLVAGGLQIRYAGSTYHLVHGKIVPMGVSPDHPQLFTATKGEDRVNSELKELRADINRINQRLSDAGVQSLRPTDGVKKVASEKQPAISFEDMIHFMTTGAVRIKLSMSGEEIETFLTGHAVNWKNVNAGIEIIATLQRIFQIACHWTTYRREREALKDPNKLSKALLTLCEAFDTDKGFYDGWKANIAMAFFDEFRNEFARVAASTDRSYPDSSLLTLCNRAAEKFLCILLPPKKGEGAPFVGANVSSMADKSATQEVKRPAGAGDTATGQWHYHGAKYWVIPEENTKPVNVPAIYVGNGIFLYNGGEFHMKPGTKTETR